MPSADEIDRVLMDLAHRRGRGKTFCPSEAARRLAADWRPLMPLIRTRAAALQGAGRLQAFQNGQPIDPVTAKGPIRLGCPDL